jgi:hypothetical protein
MLSGGAAGNLFYLERYLPGGAMFLLTALFLFYAMTDTADTESDDKEEVPGSLMELRANLGRLAVFVAENALNGAKSIGRTLPSTQQELSRMEDGLTEILDSLPVDREDRQHIAEEFDKLRTRSRQSEGRRVLTNQRF